MVGGTPLSSPAIVFGEQGATSARPDHVWQPPCLIGIRHPPPGLHDVARVSRRHSRRFDPAMGKVMVVDDAYSEIQLMESILKSAGHQVLSFTEGDQIEDKIAAERPDVVLLDIVMPKRNGYEILRGLRRNERTQETRVVVVSAKNQESDRAWGLRQGADEYLGKPFTPEQLLSAVRRFAR